MSQPTDSFDPTDLSAAPEIDQHLRKVLASQPHAAAAAVAGRTRPAGRRLPARPAQARAGGSDAADLAEPVRDVSPMRKDGRRSPDTTSQGTQL
jgi:hypothetical protein